MVLRSGQITNTTYAFFGKTPLIKPPYTSLSHFIQLKYFMNAQPFEWGLFFTLGREVIHATFTRTGLLLERQHFGPQNLKVDSHIFRGTCPRQMGRIGVR